MPCHTRMKIILLKGILWLYLWGFSFMVASLEPGFLDFDNLPDTNFSCVGKVIGGYYADLETSCQMFHVCTIGQLDEPMDIRFLCLNGTVFDQETRVCERIDEVDCSKSEQFYSLNLELYGNTQPPILEDSADTDPPPDTFKPQQHPASTSTTTTTTPRPPTKPKTTRPNFIITTTPKPQTQTIIDEKFLQSHHFPDSNSADIRFNPEEINISLNPGAPPNIRQKPVSFQQSISENNKRVIVTTHTTLYKNENNNNKPIISTMNPQILETQKPKSIYDLNQPTGDGGNYNYNNAYQTEKNLDYETEIPHHEIPFRPSFRPSSRDIEQHYTPKPVEYKSSTFRTQYHPTTISPVRIGYNQRGPTTYRNSYSSPLKPALPYYHRTDKPPRIQLPLPLIPTLSPLTFSSPAPFSLNRHIESKRFADHHQPPRIVISASASVSDATGRKFNYSLGTIGDSRFFGQAPHSYDDYKEDDVGLDPFYHDVPKLKRSHYIRQRRSAEEVRQSGSLAKSRNHRREMTRRNNDEGGISRDQSKETLQKVSNGNENGDGSVNQNPIERPKRIRKVNKRPVSEVNGMAKRVSDGKDNFGGLGVEENPTQRTKRVRKVSMRPIGDDQENISEISKQISNGKKSGEISDNKENSDERNPTEINKERVRKTNKHAIDDEQRKISEGFGKNSNGKENGMPQKARDDKEYIDGISKKVKENLDETSKGVDDGKESVGDKSADQNRRQRTKSIRKINKRPDSEDQNSSKELDRRSSGNKKNVDEISRRAIDGTENLDEIPRRTSNGKENIDVSSGRHVDGKENLDVNSGRTIDGKNNLEPNSGERIDGKENLDENSGTVKENHKNVIGGNKNVDGIPRKAHDGIGGNVDGISRGAHNAKENIDGISVSAHEDKENFGGISGRLRNDEEKSNGISRRAHKSKENITGVSKSAQDGERLVENIANQNPTQRTKKLRRIKKRPENQLENSSQEHYSKRVKRKPEEEIKDEKEAIEVLKFLFNWYNSHEKSSETSIPIKPETITEINKELTSNLDSEYYYEDYDYTTKFEVGRSTPKTGDGYKYEVVEQDDPVTKYRNSKALQEEQLQIIKPPHPEMQFNVSEGVVSVTEEALKEISDSYQGVEAGNVDYEYVDDNYEAETYNHTITEQTDADRMKKRNEAKSSNGGELEEHKSKARDDFKKTNINSEENFKESETNSKNREGSFENESNFDEPEYKITATYSTIDAEIPTQKFRNDYEEEFVTNPTTEPQNKNSEFRNTRRGNSGSRKKQKIAEANFDNSKEQQFVKANSESTKEQQFGESNYGNSEESVTFGYAKEQQFGEANFENTKEQQFEEANFENTKEQTFGDTKEQQFEETNLGNRKEQQFAKADFGNINKQQFKEQFGATNYGNSDELVNFGSAKEQQFGEGNSEKRKEQRFDEDNSQKTKEQRFDEDNSQKTKEQRLGEANSEKNKEQQLGEANSGTTNEQQFGEGNPETTKEQQFENANYGNAEFDEIREANSGAHFESSKNTADFENASDKNAQDSGVEFVDAKWEAGKDNTGGKLDENQRKFNSRNNGNLEAGNLNLEQTETEFTTRNPKNAVNSEILKKTSTVSSIESESVTVKSRRRNNHRKNPHKKSNQHENGGSRSRNSSRRRNNGNLEAKTRRRNHHRQSVATTTSNYEELPTTTISYFETNTPFETTTSYLGEGKSDFEATTTNYEISSVEKKSNREFGARNGNYEGVARNHENVERNGNHQQESMGFNRRIGLQNNNQEFTTNSDYQNFDSELTTISNFGDYKNDFGITEESNQDHDFRTPKRGSEEENISEEGDQRSGAPITETYEDFDENTKYGKVLHILGITTSRPNQHNQSEAIPILAPEVNTERVPISRPIDDVNPIFKPEENAETEVNPIDVIPVFRSGNYKDVNPVNSAEEDEVSILRPEEHTRNNKGVNPEEDVVFRSAEHSRSNESILVSSRSRSNEEVATTEEDVIPILTPEWTTIGYEAMTTSPEIETTSFDNVWTITQKGITELVGTEDFEEATTVRKSDYGRNSRRNQSKRGKAKKYQKSEELKKSEQFGTTENYFTTNFGEATTKFEDYDYGIYGKEYKEEKKAESVTTEAGVLQTVQLQEFIQKIESNTNSIADVRNISDPTIEITTVDVPTTETQITTIETTTPFVPTSKFGRNSNRRNRFRSGHRFSLGTTEKPRRRKPSITEEIVDVIKNRMDSEAEQSTRKSARRKKIQDFNINAYTANLAYRNRQSVTTEEIPKLHPNLKSDSIENNQFDPLKKLDSNVTTNFENFKFASQTPTEFDSNGSEQANKKIDSNGNHHSDSQANKKSDSSRNIHFASQANKKINSNGNQSFHLQINKNLYSNGNQRFNSQENKNVDSNENRNSTEQFHSDENPQFDSNRNFNSSENRKSYSSFHSNENPQFDSIRNQKLVSIQNLQLNSIENPKLENTEEKVTSATFSKSANPTQKNPKDLLPTTPLSKSRHKANYAFNCFGKAINKFYSDPRDCRLFHYCTKGFTKTQLLDMKFVCDLGTYFDSEKLICTKDKPVRCT